MDKHDVAGDRDFGDGDCSIFYDYGNDALVEDPLVVKI